MNDVFEAPLTELDLYWLGFLMADGYVNYSKKNKCLELGLHPRDSEQVSKFKLFTGSHNTIRVTDKVCKICVYSKELVERVMPYGLVPRKTKTAQALLGIDNSRHFWRGVVDGDGSLGVHRQRQRGYYYERPQLQLMGSWYLLVQFCNFLSSTGVHVDFYKSGSMWSFGITGKRALNVIDLLYKDSLIHLDRKKEKANTLLAHFSETEVIDYVVKEIMKDERA